MNAECQSNLGFPQRNSAEHEKYAEAQSASRLEGGEQGGADLLEKILDRNNLNKAYKKVRANKGAPGIDGMTVEDALVWLKENRTELLKAIRQGKYKPQPVRRKEIPKPDGGTRKLGIPTVVDRIIQQAIAQQLVPIYEPLFSEDSFGYRPGKSAHQAIMKVKEYAEKGYSQAVLVDLSKYFDTLNHDLLLELLRKHIRDKRVVALIKRYLKAGVLENGLVVRTEEGSPQGGPLSPLLANIYLNEYDQEMKRRGVPVVRYADDIVVLAKSPRAAQRLLETTQRFLEGKLKLRMNVEKSKVVAVCSLQDFKFLGFALGKGRDGIYIRIHAKSLKKAKAKLKELTSRSQGRSIEQITKDLKVFTQGWLGYFGIAKMRTIVKDLDGWVRRRLRACLWKQWKRYKTKRAELQKLGLTPDKAQWAAFTRQAPWAASGYKYVNVAITNAYLEERGYCSMLDRFNAMHSSG